MIKVFSALQIDPLTISSATKSVVRLWQVTEKVIWAKYSIDIKNRLEHGFGNLLGQSEI